MCLTSTLRRGFARAILQTLRCKADSVLVMGPPCSSFVFVNLATSKRSALEPYGDQTKSYVELGSLLCSRALLLLLLATVRGVYTVLEQPQTSTMKYFPDLIHVGKAIRALLGHKTWDHRFLWGPQLEDLHSSSKKNNKILVCPHAPLFAAKLDGYMGSSHSERECGLGNRVRISVFCVLQLFNIHVQASCAKTMAMLPLQEAKSCQTCDMVCQLEATQSCDQESTGRWNNTSVRNPDSGEQT